MDERKQIDEKAELEQIISDATKDYENLCEECFELGEYNPFDFDGYLAEAIYDAGYRKKSEVASEIPAVDAVKVVRCRDCKHWNEAVDLCKWFDCCTEADGFCHHGKLKGE